MNNILGFLRIPIIRFIGAAAILYFALFSNKNDPDSLRNRLSKERVDKNLHDIQAKGRFIVSNVKVAKELSLQQSLEQKLESKILIVDAKIGEGENPIKCGSEAEISYEIFTENGTKIKNINLEKIVVGSNLNPIIEKNIIDMKYGGIRNINIPKDFISNDRNIDELLKFYDSGIRYEVHLLSLIPHLDTKFSCK